MGWTFTTKPRGQTVLKFFQEQWNSATVEVLDCAVVERKTAYLAVRRTPTEGKPYIFGVVCMLEYRPKDRYPFGYKDMDESMGPYAYDCPERILNQLTDLPYSSEDATKWRRICREELAKRKAAPKLQFGTIIKLDEAATFSDGFKGDTFYCVDQKRRLRFMAVGGNRAGVYRLKKRHVTDATELKGALLTRAAGACEVVNPADGKAFTLTELQGLVGGDIQIVPLDGIHQQLVCNEEGKIKQLPLNRVATAIWEAAYGHTDMIVGNAVIVGERTGMIQ